jgi:hypothetical protein
MALDPNTQKQISSFINSQFPRLYEEYGQPFIDFVTAYYVWMETQGPLYDSRRASEYQDIDTTVAKFLVYFKDKYLPNIQLETNSNVDLLIKHSLDVYRSRGTIRSIDLLFRLVFGVGAEVYYPFDDVFQPSSGDWFIPRYLEVSTQDDLNKFVGKEIIGNTSHALAFVEGWVRKKSGSKQIDILYISALEGNFTTGEIINAVNNPFNILTCPTMIGSLSSVNIFDGGINFNIGDIVNINGTKGYGAVGRVANTSQITGTVSFTMNDGGYGYTTNAAVLVSQSVLTLQSMTPGANVLGGPNFFTIFDTVSQPMANINYQSAVGGHFVNNDLIFTYFGNGNVMGTGIVLAAANGLSTNGQIFVYINSGNLQANAIYNAGNAVSASVPVSNGYLNATATGNVIAETLTSVVAFNNISGSFINQEKLTNGSNTSAILGTISQEGPIASAPINNRVGVWVPGTTVTGGLSGATANLVSMSLGVGVINQTGSFLADTRAPIISAHSGTTGLLPVLNRGSGASFTIASLLYPETVILNTDFLAPYANTALNSPGYGFPAFPTANLATSIAASLSTNSYTVGRISGLSSITPGTGYTIPPLVRVYEPVSFYRQTVDSVVLSITGASGPFVIGDVITQSSTSARGLVMAANSSSLLAQKLSLINTFTLTSNSTTTITAISTGTTANVAALADAIFTDPENISETLMGLDADITANTSAANGSILKLQVLDSGWGYEPGEVVSMTQNGVVAQGTSVLTYQGTGTGFYRTENGFVSDIKKIQDSNYYQVSSYDIRASVAFEHYKDMLKALLHVAGTKAFGTFVYRASALVPLNIRNAKLTQIITMDGSLNAPISTGNTLFNTITTPKQGLAFSSMLSRYAARPSWKVAGIDYPVGINASALPLKDPATIGTYVPGATFSSGQVHLPSSSSTIIVDGFDFSLYNGCQVLLGTGTGQQIIKNCYFKAGSNKYNAIWDNGNIAASVLIEYNVFDGNSPTFEYLNPGQTAGYVSINAKSYEQYYNYFLNAQSEHVVSGGSVTNGILWKSSFNVYSQAGYGGYLGDHGDVVQLYGGIPGCHMNDISISYDTVVIDDTNTSSGSGGWGMQGFSINSANDYGLLTPTFEFQNNTICGAANAATKMGSGWLVNSSWFTQSITATNNYVDYTTVQGSILGWAIDYYPESQNGPGGAIINWGTGTNINLLTGLPLQSRFGF